MTVHRAVSRRAVRTLLVAGVAAVTALATAPAQPASADEERGRTVEVQLLGLNDFHGNLEPPTGSSGVVDTPTGQVPAGGAEYLATHMRRLRAGERNSFVVHQGDMIGASPFLSAAFKDEPTIEFLNRLGTTTGAAGNHEFDEGVAELLRIQHGGCHPTEGCFDDDGYAGADFTYLAGNVVNAATGRRPFPAYAIRRIGGQRIGFIGMPLEGTPEIVSAEGIRGYEFRDEVESTNRAVRELKRRGVEAIVLLVHQGDFVTPPAPENSCRITPGPVTQIAEQVDAEIDAVMSGHSHQQYNCEVRDPAGNPRPLIQGGSFGRLISEVRLTINRRTGDVVRDRTVGRNHVVTRDVPRDGATTALISKYAELARPIANRVVGRITADIVRAQTPSGESPLGNVIADAQAASTEGEQARFALMNPGGVRADLTYTSSPAGEGDGVVTYGEAFSVQPFNNVLTTMTLTGRQLDALLEQQWQPQPDGTVRERILAPSAAFSYTWSASAAVGSKVSGIRVGGTPVTDAGTYRLTVNSFLADGGDGFTVLREGTNRVTGELDLDAFTDYLAARSPVPPPATNRITRVP